MSDMNYSLCATFPLRNRPDKFVFFRLADFNPETMESCLVPGLYACGEVLDIDGDCGGYNLQWAWSSGYTAGKCAGKERV